LWLKFDTPQYMVGQKPKRTNSFFLS